MKHETPALWRTLDEQLNGAPRPDLDGAASGPKPRPLTGPEANDFVARPLGPASASTREADEGIFGVRRRTFLQVMGAMLSMGAGCTKQPEERIVPYVKAPEDIIPGQPLFYASATVLGGIATGVLVEQHEGRPTKIEGNPEHPASLGGTDAQMQAATFDLYDPDRSKTLTHLGTISNYGTLVAALQSALVKYRAKKGAGLAILTGAIGSPTLKGQIDELLAGMPLAKWHWYESVFREGGRGGATLAFGKDLEARYDLAAADVVVSLDADLFGSAEGRLAYARQFASRRREEGTPGNVLGVEASPRHPPTRLYVFEPTPSITGGRADHRYRVKAADVERVVRALASRLGVAGIAGGDPPPGVDKASLDAIAADLKKAGARAVVAAGDFQPASVHALALAINQSIGAIGKTVHVAEPALFGTPDPIASLKTLCDDIDAGNVELLVILGGNPIYDAPADFNFLDRLKKVRTLVHLGRYDDETAAHCHYHVPEAHSLETWSDGRAFDGTVSVIQPLILPLYGGKSAHELLIALSDKPDRSARDLVKATTIPADVPADAAEAAFRRVLHDGIARGAATPGLPEAAGDLSHLPAPAPSTGYEIVFRPDPSIYDGRFASNAWLQELPRPLTKITWDNAAMISVEDARELGLETGNMVELSLGARRLVAPVWVMPGQAKGSVALHLGHGRTRGSKIGVGVGVDAGRLRTSAAPWHAGSLSIKKVVGEHEFATTQGHNTMEGRDIVRSGRFGKPLAESEEEKHHLSLYPDKPYPSYAWGMAIDLTTCTGCNACVVACHAENNVPVVGREEILNRREMHWIRIDRYYEGSAEDPRAHFQPLLCQQCEQAPCEVVCPVQATAHSSEGLNDMVYNRCVGTKYCSNNCPYKVRRYNFFGYSVDDVFGLDNKAQSIQLMHNPDVTVRTYGVMEKCTYCVQRIVGARVEAKKGDRKIRDGEVMTACQAACPTRAITFGDINDPTSEVAKKKALERNYALLDELNTKPRTTYLASLWNPNPAIDAPSPPKGEGG
jgi:molybdopterin-containing oxidoreductase family iron-sulfur binding subunit